MHNYKALKTAGKASVQKVKVVEQAKVDEVKDGDGIVTTKAQDEKSREELQVVHKKYDANTGEELDIISSNINTINTDFRSLHVII